MPTYRQTLASHFGNIGNVAKDKDRKRFFVLYAGLYNVRHKHKQRAMAVEQHFAKEFQDYMTRYKRGMLPLFNPSIFFHPTNHAENTFSAVARLRKPGKMLNVYQISRYMQERKLTDEARLCNARGVQRRSII